MGRAWRAIRPGRAPRRLALPDAHARLVRAAGRAGAAGTRGASTTRRRRCGRSGRRARRRSSPSPSARWRRADRLLPRRSTATSSTRSPTCRSGSCSRRSARPPTTAALGPLPAQRPRRAGWMAQQRAMVSTDAGAMVRPRRLRHDALRRCCWPACPRSSSRCSPTSPTTPGGSPPSAPGSPRASEDPASVRAEPSSGCSRSPPSGSSAGRVALEAQGLPAIDAAPAALEALVAARTRGAGRLTLWGVTETAIFAAGCFWGVEADFRQRRRRDRHAASATRAARTEHPTYARTSARERTGHAEAVEVDLRPRASSPTTSCSTSSGPYHDPTTRNRQGFDIGSQYRSAIFFTSPEQEQRRRARATRSRPRSRRTAAAGCSASGATSSPRSPPPTDLLAAPRTTTSATSRSAGQATCAVALSDRDRRSGS